LSSGPGIVHRLTTYARDLPTHSRGEQQALLRDAAKQIQTYHNLIALYGSSAYETDADVCNRLFEYADRIDFSYVDETRQIMFEAAAAIRRLRLMLGIKQERTDDPERLE